MVEIDARAEEQVHESLSSITPDVVQNLTLLKATVYKYTFKGTLDRKPEIIEGSFIIYNPPLLKTYHFNRLLIYKTCKNSS